MILEVRDASGAVVWEAPEPAGDAGRLSPQAAYLVTDILAGNTDPRQNPIWSAKPRAPQRAEGRAPAGRGQDGHRQRGARPVDLWLPGPAEGSDGAGPRGRHLDGQQRPLEPAAAKPATSLTAAAPLWRAFVRDYREAGRSPASPGRRASSRPRSTPGPAASPGRGRGRQRRSWFIAGTQPGAKQQVDPPGLLYIRACGGWRVDPVKAELGPKAWDADVANWLAPGPARRRGQAARTTRERRTSGAAPAGAAPRRPVLAEADAEADATPRPRPRPRGGGNGHKPATPPGPRGKPAPDARSDAGTPPPRPRRRPMTSTGSADRPGGAGLALGVGPRARLLALAAPPSTSSSSLFVAVLLASGLQPVIGWIRGRLPLGRGPAILLVYGRSSRVVIGMALVIVPAAITQLERTLARLPPFLDAPGSGRRPSGRRPCRSAVAACRRRREGTPAAKPPAPGEVVQVGLTLARDDHPSPRS